MNEQEFWAALSPVEPPKQIYKLYYNDAGHPIKYSVENNPGNYVEVSVEQYLQNSFNVRVRNGELFYLKQPDVPMLIESIHGVATHVEDVTIIASKEPNKKWSLKVYEED